MAPLGRRLEQIAWPEVEAALDEQGHATTRPLLTPAGCRALAGLYGSLGIFAAGS